ncbi:MAG: dihydrofolate reductase family protein [Bacteroidota bacterium]|nr:dihydrofolate reductase family protein [Bacteroidota bacterium]MDP4253251.1 dihydrofolate reductase family protein [Bacteroidota bacterium]MDP4259894.1 dihydrofolate reductase family protein [Bacteroidota bacterium]
MKKIFVSNLITLDGYFEGPGHEIDWFKTDHEFFDYAKSMLNSADTILFGRVTYEMMAAFWPNATDEDPAITHKMNHLDKIVFSKTLTGVDWNNSRLVRDILPDEIRKWKKGPGKDMVILGSGTVMSTMAQMGLIDEYRILVNPVVVGRGNPMFSGLRQNLHFRLIGTKILGSGMVILYYEPVKQEG